MLRLLCLPLAFQLNANGMARVADNMTLGRSDRVRSVFCTCDVKFMRNHQILNLSKDSCDTKFKSNVLTSGTQRSFPAA